MAQLDDSISDWIYRHDKGPIGTRLLNRFLLAEPPILTLRDLISHHRGIGYVAMLNNIGKVSVAALVSWMAADGLKFEGNKPATRGREAASMAHYDPSKAFLEFDRCTAMMYEPHTTLRDQFAMAGLAASMNHGGSDPVKWAENAYRIADAMLEARKPKPEPAPQRCNGCHQTTCRGDCMMNAMSR